MGRVEPFVNLRKRTQRGEPQHLLISHHGSFIKFDNRILTVSTGLVNASTCHRVFRFRGKDFHYCRQELLLSKEQYLALAEVLNITNPLLGLAESWF